MTNAMIIINNHRYNWSQRTIPRHCRISYNAIIDACGKAMRWQQALHVFQAMDMRKVVPLLGAVDPGTRLKG